MLDPNTIPRPDDPSRSNDRSTDRCADTHVDRDNGKPPNRSDPEDQGSASSSNAKNFDKTFERVFYEFRPALKLRAIQIIGSKELAEDIVHDVFTKTYHLVSDGKEINIKTIEGWLFRCVQNACLNIIRKRKQATQVPLEDDDSDYTYSSDVSEQIHIEDRTMKIMDVVSDLPSKQKQAFLLYDVHGYNYKETAAELNTSPNAVRQLLFRARQNIRNNLGPEAACLAVPVLRTDLFGIEDRQSIFDRFAQQISQIATKYTGYFNQLVDRLASISTPVIAIIILGVAVVVSQSKSEEPASGATLNPALLIESIHSNPVGSADLLLGKVPADVGQIGHNDGDSYRRGTSRERDINSVYPDTSSEDASAASARKSLMDLLSNCKGCDGTKWQIVQYLISSGYVNPVRFIKVTAALKILNRTVRRIHRQINRQLERQKGRRRERHEERSNSTSESGSKTASEKPYNPGAKSGPKKAPNETDDKASVPRIPAREGKPNNSQENIPPVPEIPESSDNAGGPDTPGTGGYGKDIGRSTGSTPKKPAPPESKPSVPIPTAPLPAPPSGGSRGLSSHPTR